MSLDRAERFHAAVRAELDEERAAVLGRVARRLERARERCHALGAVIDASDGADEEALAAYRAAHDEATELRWVLGVQREAIGLYDHRWVDAVYPALRRR
jgi:hypothetical protein